jgi:hypothetical protein
MALESELICGWGYSQTETLEISTITDIVLPDYFNLYFWS